MHHTLRFYGRYQQQWLRLYLLLAKLTNLPLVGRWVRHVANIYARRGHGGYLLTVTEAEQIIDAAGSVALGPCCCRQVSRHCDHPITSEIVVSTGAEVFSQTRRNEFHKVSKEAAKELLRQCHQQRLVTTIMKCREHFYAICNCCSCCCVPTILRQNYGIEYALVRNKDILADFQRHQL